MVIVIVASRKRKRQRSKAWVGGWLDINVEGLVTYNRFKQPVRANKQSFA